MSRVLYCPIRWLAAAAPRDADLIRRALGRPFRQSEVDAIDKALDEVSYNSFQDSVPGVPHYPAPCAISADGVALIRAAKQSQLSVGTD